MLQAQGSVGAWADLVTVHGVAGRGTLEGLQRGVAGRQVGGTAAADTTAITATTSPTATTAPPGRSPDSSRDVLLW